MYYRITVYDDDPDSSARNTKLNVDDAGTFTWLHSDDTVHFVEGETAKLNWSIQIGTGKTWLSVKITRGVQEGGGLGDVDLIRRKSSGVEILLAERGADMDLDVQVNSNVLNVTFTLRNLSRKTDEMYYRITVIDDDPDTSARNTKLNVNVPSSCEIHPNAITVNETDNILLNVTTTGNPPVQGYTWTFPNGSTVSHDNNILTFTASRQDAGTYKVSVYNGIGGPSYCTSNVTVQFKPRLVNISIIKGPLSTARDENGIILANETDSFNLTCDSHAKPEATYQWTVPDTSLFTELNHQILVFNKVSRDYTGEYICTASNIVGATISSKNLTVYFRPKISLFFCQGCQSEDSLENHTITLFCNATGKPIPNITWTKNGEAYNVSSSVSRSSSMIVFQKFALSDSGNYTCIAHNGIGNPDKKTIYLLTNLPPTISSPGTVTVNETQTAQLVCTASGNPAPSINWTRDGVLVGTGSPFTTPVVLYSDDKACYTCVAYNGVLDAKTANVCLNVKYKPRSTLRLVSDKSTVCQNDKVRLTCTSGPANPAPSSYEFYDNGVLIGTSASNVYEATATAGLPAVNSFVCVPRNLLGSALENGSVEVSAKVAPRIVTSPQATTVVEGSALTLFCNASGTPAPNITWTKVGGSNVGNIETYTIISVTRGDEGTYRCTATNSGECSNVTADANIVVNYPPENTTISTNQSENTLLKGNSVKLSCVSRSKPQLCNVTFYHGNTVLQRYSDKTCAGVEAASHVIQNIDSCNLEEYSCKVENQYGQQEAKVNLTIKVPATIAISPAADVITEEGNSLHLNCTATGCPTPNITWTKIGNSGSLQVGNGFVLYHRIGSLSKSDTGSYKCSVDNGVVGSPVDRTIYVNVTYKPYLTNLTSTLSNACLNDSVTLQCATDANPPAYEYRFYLNDVLVHTSMSGVYQFNVPQAGNNTYKCEPKNAVGAGQNGTVLIITKDVDDLEVIGSSNKSYSRPNPLVFFNLSINAYPSNTTSLSCRSSTDTLTSITSHDAGLYTKQYLVFVLVKSTQVTGSIVCTAKHGAGVRERTLHYFERPILYKTTVGGQFVIRNQDWRDELKDATSAVYKDLRKKCIQIIKSAYSNSPFLADVNIKDFLKGSTIVRFQLGVLGQVSDPLLPLRDYIKRQKQEVDGLRIDYDSIQTSSDLKDESPNQTEEQQNKSPVVVLAVLFALAVFLNIILIAIIIWLRRKGNFGKSRSKSREKIVGQMKDIALQETSFDATENGLEDEAIRRRGLAASNAGTPEYEAVTTRTRPPQPQANNPMPQYESADQHRIPGAYSNTPSVTYQTIQPRTGEYGSLSPSTRLPPTGTSTQSPTRPGEYEALHHKGVAPQYQSLDDLSRC